MKRFSKNNELILWLLAIVIPFFIDPNADVHFSFCLFSNVGISWCPGCGIGNSIAFFYKGEIIKSIQTHPFGIPAIIIILLRIYKLSNINPKPTKPFLQ